MKRLIFLILSFYVFLISIQAQELNAKVTVNTQKLESPNSQLFSSLERSLNQFLNERKWTDLTFGKNERINCNISIFVNEMKSEDSFTGEMQITIQRPVYNSTYVTSIFNYRDTQFEFNYLQGQSMDFNNYTVDNNLVAVMSFYAYVIIGLDADTFSMNGGNPYFTKAMEIANMAQGLNSKGWEPFSGKNNNRYDLAVALTDESSKNFHNMWYNYHRMGLDEMAANSSRARIRIEEVIADDLPKLQEARPNSILLPIIAESKIDEIVRVCSKSTEEEKQNMKKILSRIFPTKKGEINELK